MNVGNSSSYTVKNIPSTWGLFYHIIFEIYHLLCSSANNRTAHLLPGAPTPHSGPAVIDE